MQTPSLMVRSLLLETFKGAVQLSECSSVK